MGIWNDKDMNNTVMPGSWQKNKTKDKSYNKALDKHCIVGSLLTCPFFYFSSYPSPTLVLEVGRGREKTFSLGAMKNEHHIW